MKIKLLRCGICHNWYLCAFHHCPACNATPVMIGRKHAHVNAATGRQIVRSLSQARSIAALYTELLASVLE